ncbi:MAG: NifU family protein [Proteobacteria bacterium]|nr:NifU family protein [Pseudomonadota bacterium]
MINIRIQSTPNPRAQKYIVQESVKSSSKISYQEPDECQHVPLAHGLLQIPGVIQVHLFENVVTITQNGARNWQELDQLVEEIIDDLITDHDPDFVEHLNQSVTRDQDIPEHVRAIEDILDSTIRPSLQMDGGDVEVLDMSGDVVTVRYLGACGGCPSAFEGTLYAMQEAISDGLGKPVEVVAV